VRPSRSFPIVWSMSPTPATRTSAAEQRALQHQKFDCPWPPAPSTLVHALSSGGPGIKRTSPALRSQGCCTNTRGLTVWGAAPNTGSTSPAVGGPQHHEAARRFEAGPPERPAGPSYGVQCASRRSKPQSAIADLYFAEELQACLGHDAHQGLAAAEMLPLQSRLQESHTDGPCCAADEPHNASAMLPSGVAEWLLFTDAAHLVLDRPKLASERGRSKSA
jgi:hypothetical protein